MTKVDLKSEQTIFQNPMLQFPFPVKCDFAEAVKVPGEKQLLNFPIPLLPNTKMIILILDTSKSKKFFLHV